MLVTLTPWRIGTASSHHHLLGDGCRRRRRRRDEEEDDDGDDDAAAIIMDNNDASSSIVARLVVDRIGERLMSRQSRRRRYKGLSTPLLALTSSHRVSIVAEPARSSSSSSSYVAEECPRRTYDARPGQGGSFLSLPPPPPPRQPLRDGEEMEDEDDEDGSNPQTPSSRTKMNGGTEPGKTASSSSKKKRQKQKKQAKNARVTRMVAEKDNDDDEEKCLTKRRIRTPRNIPALFEPAHGRVYAFQGDNTTLCVWPSTSSGPEEDDSSAVAANYASPTAAERKCKMAFPPGKRATSMVSIPTEYGRDGVVGLCDDGSVYVAVFANDGSPRIGFFDGEEDGRDAKTTKKGKGKEVDDRGGLAGQGSRKRLLHLDVSCNRRRDRSDLFVDLLSKRKKEMRKKKKMPPPKATTPKAEEKEKGVNKKRKFGGSGGNDEPTATTDTIAPFWMELLVRCVECDESSTDGTSVVTATTHTVAINPSSADGRGGPRQRFVDRKKKGGSGDPMDSDAYGNDGAHRTPRLQGRHTARIQRLDVPPPPSATKMTTTRGGPPTTIVPGTVFATPLDSRTFAVLYRVEEAHREQGKEDEEGGRRGGSTGRVAPSPRRRLFCVAYDLSTGRPLRDPFCLDPLLSGGFGGNDNDNLDARTAIVGFGGLGPSVVAIALGSSMNGGKDDMKEEDLLVLCDVQRAAVVHVAGLDKAVGSRKRGTLPRFVEMTTDCHDGTLALLLEHPDGSLGVALSRAVLNAGGGEEENEAARRRLVPAGGQGDNNTLAVALASSLASASSTSCAVHDGTATQGKSHLAKSRDLLALINQSLVADNDAGKKGGATCAPVRTGDEGVNAAVSSSCRRLALVRKSIVDKKEVVLTDIDDFDRRYEEEYEAAVRDVLAAVLMSGGSVVRNGKKNRPRLKKKKGKYTVVSKRIPAAAKAKYPLPEEGTPAKLPQPFVDEAFSTTVDVLFLLKKRDVDRERTVGVLFHLLSTDKVSARSHLSRSSLVGSGNALLSMLTSCIIDGPTASEMSVGALEVMTRILKFVPDVPERSLVTMLRFVLCHTTPDEAATYYLKHVTNNRSRMETALVAKLYRDAKSELQSVQELIGEEHDGKRKSNCHHQHKRRRKQSGKDMGIKSSLEEMSPDPTVQINKLQKVVETLSKRLVAAAAVNLTETIVSYSKCNDALLRGALCEGLEAENEVKAAMFTLAKLLRQSSGFESAQTSVAAVQWISALTDAHVGTLAADAGEGSNTRAGPLGRIRSAVQVALAQAEAAVGVQDLLDSIPSAPLDESGPEISSIVQGANSERIGKNEKDTFVPRVQPPPYSIERLQF